MLVHVRTQWATEKRDVSVKVSCSLDGHLNLEMHTPVEDKGEAELAVPNTTGDNGIGLADELGEGSCSCPELAEMQKHIPFSIAPHTVNGTALTFLHEVFGFSLIATSIIESASRNPLFALS